MAELNMANATYGRDVEGQKRLITNLTKKIEAAAEAVKGKDYTNLIRTVKMYWSGADADRFLEVLEEETNEIQAQIKQYASQLEAAIEEDAKSFAQMQETNSDLIYR